METDLNSLPLGWQIYLQQYPEFMKTFRRIAGEDWYAKNGWCAFVGHYTHGIFLQVFKPHWFNQQLEGIHFELACDAACLRSGTGSLQLHITHKDVLPDRERFNAVSVPRLAACMRGWDSRYMLSTSKLSERLNVRFKFTPSTFAAKATDEIRVVCQLGAVIDETLAELWP